jgi:hypothetical protein
MPMERGHRGAEGVVSTPGVPHWQGCLQSFAPKPEKWWQDRISGGVAFGRTVDADSFRLKTMSGSFSFNDGLSVQNTATTTDAYGRTAKCAN